MDGVLLHQKEWRDMIEDTVNGKLRYVKVCFISDQVRMIGFAQYFATTPRPRPVDLEIIHLVSH